MKRRTAIAAITSGVSGAALLAAKFIQPYIKDIFTGHQATSANGIKSNPITIENALPGTTDWMIPAGKEATVEIQAYVGTRSAAPGQTLTFYVSTQRADTSYTLNIYRLGWYQGKGGRLMTSIHNLVGQEQGYYNERTFELVNSPSTHVDTTTRLVEANWRPSYTLAIPSNWTTGVYLAKFIDAYGMQTYTKFVVRGNPTAPYVLVTPDATDAAYNNWGGYSLYASNSKNGNPATKVSLDRPSMQNQGSDYVLIYEINSIRWFEQQGYNLSYISNLDMHANNSLLLQHKAYISLGHDEYWTKEMRDGVENARNQGIGLAFLAANASYWQVRLEPSTSGVPNRTVVCYKVLSEQNDLEHDPLYGHQNDLVTTQWRDPLLNRPENTMIGIMYSNYNDNQRSYAWQVDASANSTFLRGTGLIAGQIFNNGIVGYEWDKIFNNGQTPKSLQVIATSPTVTSDGQPDVSHTTYYVAPSGSLVFASGSNYWTSALDDYRYGTHLHWTNGAKTVSAIQKLMSNVMDALIASRFMGQ
ncbi:MAG: hypothetical protein JOZ18_03465 [Chloroflexi bacterium]|nr:hypothetical protein [Chloroflexota bacterium]